MSIMHHGPTRGRAFTIIELLVVVSIIALLIGILLPAIGKARDQAKVTQSQANMRNLGVAHAAYASEWNDRQFTLSPDNLGRYGSVAQYVAETGNGDWGVAPGWTADGQYIGYWMDWPGNADLATPMEFSGQDTGFGWFRVPNAKPFSQYLNGRFYDPVFYAPKDTVVTSVVEQCDNDPGEFCDLTIAVEGFGDAAAWSSYCLSPAALYAPAVLDFDAAQVSGYLYPGGFRTPSMSQALYPDLKTHMCEHHWLQNVRSRCNPAILGPFDGCEPYYFNLAFESVPVTLFYDGHVGQVGVQEAMAADSRFMSQVGNASFGENGLWHRAALPGDNGYFTTLGYDFSETSFHILTTDGIRGRDTLGSGG